ncbi:DUF423 domain-containing protein [Glaesserella sp.]|uniref:DUF423 domain-containing protein n=1 Tax=Glaesserella sp. TaxID=2094731 RepID=UPI0035A19217
MKNKFIATAALSGFFCIALGAFAAHGLQKTLEPKALAWIDTGLEYQMFHTLALLALGLFQIANSVQKVPACRTNSFNLIGASWLLGILLFSGSLYALAFGVTKAVVWITPIGGTFFLIGWVTLAYISLRKSK